MRRDSRVLARLSRRAVEYVAALRLGDTAELAARLYRYNSLPASPELRRRATDDRAAARPGASYRRGVWETWEDDSAPPVAGPMYKLYASPTPAGTGGACSALLDALGRRDGPVAVKLAGDPLSLLRPDRLVAHFATRDACLATAARVAPALADLPVQGVPFTTPLTESGILSWGADPPAEATAALPPDARSWRGWLTWRLAAAIIASAADRDPARGALARLRREGVDTELWSGPWH